MNSTALLVLAWLSAAVILHAGCDGTSKSAKTQGGETDQSAPTSGETTMTSQKQPQTERCFQPAPDFDSAAEFVAWFEAQAADESSRPRLRLPVAVSVSDNPLGGVEASVSVAGDASTDEPVALHLDDSALGVPLPTRLGELCPDDVERCVVWLDGVAGALVGQERFAPPSGDEARSLTFAVLAVGERVARSEGSLQVLVEAREAEADCTEVRTNSAPD